MSSSPSEASVPLRPWCLLIDGPQSGWFNMALDETLLHEVSREQAKDQTFLRFYQWNRPTLSLGLSQKPERVVNLEYCATQGIDVVRRPTGGKAVLHDRELTYAVISNDRAFFPIPDIPGTYCRIAKALQRGILSLGIETALAPVCRSETARRPPSAACFAMPNRHELLWQNRKLAGSAQRRTKTAFLQHGSILIEFDAERLSNSLRSCDVAVLNSGVTDLKACLGSTPTIHEVIVALSRGFEAALGARLVNTELSADLSAKAEDLLKQRRSELHMTTVRQGSKVS